MDQQQNHPLVRIWLWTIAALIFCMVIVGGATRLTDSGLSITEWKPLLGAIPPLNDAHWLEAFEKYKVIPEYQLQNKWMNLEDFKFIYWWEWGHRFLGRFIGVAFIVPLLYLIATKKLARNLWPKLLLLFVLGGLQGALGWFMVASGLSERVDVSQYRLAAHLTLAFILFAAVVWIALSLDKQRNTVKPPAVLMIFMTLLFFQIALGGFVAGLDAGHASYTWPKMNGAWVPDGLAVMQPIWRNWFENALAVQFNHRLMAYALLALAFCVAVVSKVGSGWMVFAAVVAQAVIGILTVLWQIPLWTALMHQGTALIVLALALWHLAKLTRGPVQDRR
jgi:heme a synthase